MWSGPQHDTEAASVCPAQRTGHVVPALAGRPDPPAFQPLLGGVGATGARHTPMMPLGVGFSLHLCPYCPPTRVTLVRSGAPEPSAAILHDPRALLSHSRGFYNHLITHCQSLTAPPSCTLFCLLSSSASLWWVERQCGPPHTCTAHSLAP